LSSLIYIDILAYLEQKLREDLRELVRLIEKEKQKIYYTDFDDELGQAEETDLVYTSKLSEGYRVRVERYIRQHVDHLTIRKLHTNRPITERELVELERILFDGQERGTKEDFVRELGSEQPLGAFIRSLLGLDMKAAKGAFAEFLDKGQLNADQVAFINQIIEYFHHEGVLDRQLLFESPFTDQHDEGVFGLFDDQKADRIIEIIDQVNGNARVAVG
jgi:type I restriction enzyme, R subunit